MCVFVSVYLLSTPPPRDPPRCGMWNIHFSDTVARVVVRITHQTVKHYNIFAENMFAQIILELLLLLHLRFFSVLSLRRIIFVSYASPLYNAIERRDYTMFSVAEPTFSINFSSSMLVCSMYRHRVVVSAHISSVFAPHGSCVCCVYFGIYTHQMQDIVCCYISTDDRRLLNEIAKCFSVSCTEMWTEVLCQRRADQPKSTQNDEYATPNKIWIYTICLNGKSLWWILWWNVLCVYSLPLFAIADELSACVVRRCVMCVLMVLAARDAHLAPFISIFGW